MLKGLKKSLQSAEGRSEFIIAVVCDIRGFSAFSTIHESPDIAMFIKRFYLKLLNDYFTTVSFAKTTGDGLLMTFKYSETNLNEIVKLVLDTCFKALIEFPKMFEKDPMINFPTPCNLGFGITRGTACCLFSGKRVLDYSGQLLNLAARLNDLARPKGIVIDGAFQLQVIPELYRTNFVQCRAYIRSIAEETSREILCTKDVLLPSYSQAPLTSHEWLIKKKEMSVEELRNLDGNYEIMLPHEPLTMEKTKLEFFWPYQKVKSYLSWCDYRPYQYYKDAKGHHLRFDTALAQSIVIKQSLSPSDKIAFEFQYVPKPKSKIKR